MALDHLFLCIDCSFHARLFSQDRSLILGEPSEQRKGINSRLNDHDKKRQRLVERDDQEVKTTVICKK